MDDWVPWAERQELSFAHSLPPRKPDPKCAVLHTNGGGPNLAPWWESQYKRTNERICAHFQVLNHGHLIQYVPLSRVAFAAYASNDFAIQIETEDDGDPHVPWTEDQIGTIVRLLDHLGIPAHECVDDHSPGVGWHEQWDTWNLSGHACPGRVREGQIQHTIVPAMHGEPHKGSHQHVPAWYDRVLKYTPGQPLMHGVDVKQAQAAVGLTGSSLDGKYGPETANHVKHYQGRHRVKPADGILGPNTAHAIWLEAHRPRYARA